MNFDATSLLVSFVISSAGFVLFTYGRRMGRGPHILTGLALLVYPYFVPSVTIMMVIAAAIAGALWFAVKLGW
jgi:hypothetical protein